MILKIHSSYQQLHVASYHCMQRYVANMQRWPDFTINSFCARPHESMQPHDLLTKSCQGIQRLVCTGQKVLVDLISARLSVDRQSAMDDPSSTLVFFATDGFPHRINAQWEPSTAVVQVKRRALRTQYNNQPCQWKVQQI